MRIPPPHVVQYPDSKLSLLEVIVIVSNSSPSFNNSKKKKIKITTPNTKTLESDTLPFQSHAHISFFPLFHMKFSCTYEECKKYDKFGIYY